MHVLESFALNSGLKIDKPYIYEKYIPLPIEEDEKYIIVQPYTDSQSKNYEHWTETLNILIQILNGTKIKILLLGEVPHIQPFDVMKVVPDYSQLAYLIKRCEVYIGPDSLGIHLASSLNKKIVGIYSSFPKENTGPYWSEPEDLEIIDVSHSKGMPSYWPNENPKVINSVNPEDIVEKICKFLNVDYNYPFKTLHIGSAYNNRKVELNPESYLVNYQEFLIDSVIVRMDMQFNLSSLEKQLNISPCSIVTNKTIDMRLITKYQKRIQEMIYFVEGGISEEEKDFFQKLKFTGVIFHLASRLSGETLNNFKLDYLDYPRILEIPYGSKEDIKDKIKDANVNQLYYKSSNFIVKGQKFYDNPMQDTKPNAATSTVIPTPSPVIDHELFWRGLDNMIILEKTS